MKTIRKALAVILAVCFCLGVVGVAASAQEWETASEIEVGDTFYFGSYPQTRVTDSDLLSRLNAIGKYGINTVSLDGGTYQSETVSGYAVPGGDEGKIYTEIYGYQKGKTYWFEVEPIAWRVLASNDDEVLLMAEKVLTTHEYNKQVRSDNTWANSDIREWLNSEFASTAFTPNEQKYILLSDTPNCNSYIPGTTGVGGSDTQDHIFLPSFEEITDKSLGFLNADYDCYDDWSNYAGYYAKEPLRQALSTDFARCKGVWVDTRNTGDGEVEQIDGKDQDLGNVDWEAFPDGSGREFAQQARYWLRSGGSYSPTYASAVLENGRVTTGWPVNYTIVGIRPWMRVSPDAIFDDSGMFHVDGIDDSVRYRQPNLQLTSDLEGKVTWSTSDPSIATVDADGNVTIHGVGTVIFMATDEYGNTFSKTVEVRYVWWQYIIRIFLFGWIWY